MRISRSFSGSRKALLVNWLPWSVLKISGVPWARASFRASMQKTVSRVLDSPQDRTYRLCPIVDPEKWTRS